MHVNHSKSVDIKLQTMNLKGLSYFLVVQVHHHHTTHQQLQLDMVLFGLLLSQQNEKTLYKVTYLVFHHHLFCCCCYLILQGLVLLPKEGLRMYNRLHQLNHSDLFYKQYDHRVCCFEWHLLGSFFVLVLIFSYRRCVAYVIQNIPPDATKVKELLMHPKNYYYFHYLCHFYCTLINLVMIVLYFVVVILSSSCIITMMMMI
mmetsp:Transcript_25789/g.29489  ORF Transcript_25789/g.29489 Transcript_25789/m.29489 type:complete len:202 (+) Transcript_25789:700-1305(+)